jgi:SAM-dependent methyltransferase
MHDLSARDGTCAIDWGKTSADYALFRPGPPDSFYARLKALGVGTAGQRILDLGTGTGVLARRFAREGAKVAGIDVAAEQVEAAKVLAAKDGLAIDFRVSPAEETPFPSGSFDVLTANQCWLYFDKAKAIAEAKRLLAPSGVLVTSHFSWLPRLDPVARASEALVLQHNPQWSASDWSGFIPPMPAWAEGPLTLRAMFWYDEKIPFTRAQWCGRFRACRGIGATLAPKQVEAFDAEHAALLGRLAPETFTVLHRLDAHVFEPKA